METIREGINIGLKHLSNHPRNVRKDYGDLTELTESIKEMGLLQNLVVVEAPGNDPSKLAFEKDYWVVAGNRRLLALKEANKDKNYPYATCKIVDMTESEQIAMMLTENINRSSLTPLEEADGFQMMLDLGDTVDDIAKKTGFGKTTVRHRLNIAKIDKDVISQKNEDGWQVSLKDFEKLEKVPPEKRSEILEKSTSSQNMDWQIEAYAREKEKKKNRQLTLESIEAKGIGKLPDGASGYAIIKTLDYGEECPDIEGGAYWREGYNWFAIVQQASDNEEDEETEEEREERLAEEAKEDARQKIRGIAKSMDDDQHDFVNMRIEEGRLPGDKQTTLEVLWNTIVRTETGINQQQIVKFFTGKQWYDTQPDAREEAWQQYLRLPTELQMLIAVSTKITGLVNSGGVPGYQGRYDEAVGQKLQVACSALNIFGFSPTYEQQTVIYGTSELYAQED